MTAHDLQINQLKIQYENRALMEHDKSLKEILEFKASELQSYNLSIETCIRAMKIHQETKPYLVMGIPASNALISSILSATFTFFASIITLYYRGNH
jgi:hypothetical protein